MRGLLQVIVLSLCFLATSSSYASVSLKNYHSILDSVEVIYKEHFDQANQRLVIHREWDNQAAQASAWVQEDRQGQISEVRIPGGIARHPLISNDSFALIVCHEIGHHLAGGPKIWRFSVEGQADFYSTSVCMKQLLPEVPHTAGNVRDFIPEDLLSRCAHAYETYYDVRLCLRSSLAGLELAQFFATEKSLPMPSLATADWQEVDKTTMVAPNPQCRLDTYVRGALCNVDGGGDCGPQHVAEARPRCWYNSDGGTATMQSVQSLLGAYPSE